MLLMYLSYAIKPFLPFLKFIICTFLFMDNFINIFINYLKNISKGFIRFSLFYLMDLFCALFFDSYF